MSPQRSNREQLLAGAMRCLERLPLNRVTAREVADEAGANLASIGYHFGSKDALVTAAVIEGLDRWLEEVQQGLSGLGTAKGSQRLNDVNAIVERTRRRHAGLVQNFFAAVAMARHDTVVRDQLADGFTRTRPAIARLLGFGDEGDDAATLALAMFYGLLIQTELDPASAVSGDRFDAALAQLLQR
ncbi:TetR/AcrR family transcriptional regulator [Mycolicibacterium arseniciresistens]|uniref:TetR/AcrR family transcriptional regulator n=1 Tax=Mycolicibacterium arseniciresistens TaxID=3062257 RepID=A0ABT8UCF3_9MYCO|nr:TetR/AcrR family transcriptional regulator [Mycolicibacterium arseniciresistens]MDO3635447.1 TetR/AcrR family transcriptional regulator [Mycolicibacterium arseniciresistens]